MSSQTVTTPKTAGASSSSHTTLKLGARVEERSFTMKIENFEVVINSDNYLKAQRYDFQAGATVGLPVRIAFYLERTEPVKESGKNAAEKWVGGYFELVEKPKDVEEVYISFTETVKFSNGKSYGNVRKSQVTNLVGDSWGYSELFNTTSSLASIIPADGCVYIEVTFRLFAPNPSTLDISSKLRQFHDKSYRQLSQDLGDNQALTEFKGDAIAKIVSKDKVIFPVNRGVLAARSSVFMRMFQSEMKEAATGEVHIDDLFSKTLNVLLFYIQTGTLHDDWRSEDVLKELTYAAAKYGLELLTEFLYDVLGSVCSMGNAGQLAVLANRLGMEKAEQELIQFIKNGLENPEDLLPMLDQCSDAEGHKRRPSSRLLRFFQKLFLHRQRTHQK